MLDLKQFSLAKTRLTGFTSLRMDKFTVVFLIFLKTSGSVIGKFVKQEIESQLKNAVFRDEMRRSFVYNLNTGHQTGRGLFLLQKAPSCRPSVGNSPEKCASQDKAFRAHLALRARLRRVALETLRCGSQCGARRGLRPSTPRFFEKNRVKLWFWASSG